LVDIKKIDLHVSKLTQVIETLKNIRDVDCFKLLKETEPSLWIQRSEGLVSGSSSCAEHQATEKAVKAFFISSLQAAAFEDEDNDQFEGIFKSF
jgi:hypothetical protein